MMSVHRSWLAVAAITALLAACSENRSAGGNSAETGNPELSGSLTLISGFPAVGARVRCVPAGFDATSDTLAITRQTVTDSSGSFHLDSMVAGLCALEASNDSGLQMLLPPIAIDSGTKSTAVGVLLPSASLRIGAGDLEEGATGRIVVPGTSILRSVAVKFGSVFVDSLPAGTLDSVIFVPDSGDRLCLGTAVSLPSGGSVSVSSPSIRYQLDLELATDSSGVDLQEDLHGFPLLVRLDSSRLDFQAILQSTPLRIVKTGDTVALPYRITRWLLEPGRVDIWVRMDTLPAQSSDFGLTLLWDEDSSWSSGTGQPFAIADGYVAAWHFEDRDSVARDAGEYGFDGQASNVSSSGGAIGRGFWFDGVKSFVSIHGSEVGPLDFQSTDSVTINVWTRLDRPNTSRYILGKGPYQYHLQYQYNNGWLWESIDDKATPDRHWTFAPYDSAAETGKWMMLTVVQRDSIALVYRNGTLTGDTTRIAPASGARASSGTFEIGRFLDSTGVGIRVFWGVIDEIAVSSKVRSPEWIRVTMRNQTGDDYWP